MRSWIFGGALALSACGVVACIGDDSSNVLPGSDSGEPTPDGGHGPDGSVADDGGADATTSDATASDAGSDTSSDAPSLDAATDAPHDAGAPMYALFVGTDFSRAELSVVALHPDAVGGRLPIADQDSVPFASGGAGFVLERAVGRVVVLGHAQPWTSTATIDTNDAPDAAPYSSNPRAVLVTNGSKAYVARYASNVVKIVDVASGQVTGSVDLSAFVAADDTDGLADVQDAVYDPTTRRAYFLLERINQFDFSGSAPDYVSQCLPSHGEIVAIDVTNDSIVDLNGAAAGQAIDLLGKNPAQLIADFAGGRLIVPETGCYELPDGGADAGPTTRAGRGVEAVAIATGTPTWLYQTTALDRLAGVIWVDATHAFVNQGSWFAWNPTQASLGAAIADFPQAPLYDGAGRIVGLSVAQPDASSDAGVTWSVVAWDVGTSKLSTIAAAPFQSVVPAASYGVTSALLY